MWEILITIFPLESFSLLSWLGGSSFRGFHLAFPSTVTYLSGQRTTVNVRVMPTINYMHSDCTFENRDAQQLVFKASRWSISHTKSRRWSWDRHNSSSFSHAAFFFFFLTNWRFVATLRQASLPVLFAHSLSLCRMVETLAIVQTFSLLLYLLCWSVISGLW